MDDIDRVSSVADLVAATLQAAGIKQVFGYPGDPIIEFMECCRRRGVEIVLGRREGSAGFMAEGHAMASGTLGVCMSTLGPGSTALVNPVAAATLDRVPMLAISGQIETARQAFFTHQVIDHEQLFRPVTKWAGRLEPGAVAVTLRKALRTATAERPGAVHLSCASDVFNGDAGGAQPELPPLRPSGRSLDVFGPRNDPDALLAGARRPILLVGIGAMRCGAGVAVQRFAHTVGLPVVMAPMAKGVLTEDDEWYAGVIDMACNGTVWQLISEADLIVAAGFDPVELIKPWQLRTPVLHVDTVPNTDQVYASEIEVVGDVAAGLDWLTGSWSSQPRWTAAEIRRFRAGLCDVYYRGRVAGRLNPTDVIDTASACAPAGTIVTADVGSHKFLVGQGWRALEPRTVLMTNGLSAMGFGVPAAIGAKLARPERAVMAIVGDGGFAMTATELRLASALGLGLAVVVLVDGSLNRIELKQQALGYPSTATRIEDMNLVMMAEAMECDGVRVESAEELDKALTGFGGLSRPLIVEARVDPSQYVSQF